MNGLSGIYFRTARGNCPVLPMKSRFRYVARWYQGKLLKIPFSGNFMPQPFQRPDYFLFAGPRTGYSFPTGMNPKAPRGMIWVALGLVLALVLFTTLEVAGVVAARGFAILCLVAMIIAGVAFYRVLKSVSTAPPAGERPLLSERKRWYVLSAAFVWVVLASWLTRGGPWLPRLVGAAVVVAFVAPLMLRKRS
jgi:hypothetical protein